jgi:hypothetical protein
MYIATCNTASTSTRFESTYHLHTKYFKAISIYLEYRGLCTMYLLKFGQTFMVTKNSAFSDLAETIYQLKQSISHNENAAKPRNSQT